MRAVTLWSSAGATSVVANAALLGILALAIRPLPHAPQPLLPPSLDMVTPDVPRDKALAVDARGQETGTEQATGARAGAVAVPFSQAAEAKLPSSELRPLAGPPPVAATRVEGAPVMPAVKADPAISAASATGNRVEAVRVDAAQLTADPVPSGQITEAAPPALTSVPSTAFNARPMTAIAANGTVALPSAATGAASAALQAPAAAAPTAEPGQLAAQAPALVPPSDHAVAALAWAGDTGAIESSSLSAIAAFMRPGDVNHLEGSAGKLRDGLLAALEAVPCSRLQTVFVPETGLMELRGHLPDAALRAPLVAALQAQVGGAIPVVDKTLILPRPQCTALSGIATVGLPQSDEQITNPRVVGPDAQVREYRFSAGDRMVLDLQAPDYDSYVYVDYFDARGNVLHLQPNDVVPLTPVRAREHLAIGGNDPSHPSLQITVSPPFGQEIAVAFAASAPLYLGLRPIEEPAAPYLQWLRDRVTEARARDSGFKGEWVYFFVSTSAH